jgi:hypothetical protein
MKSAARRGRVASTKTIASPVGGLNALNALAEMPETDAVQLDNWFPRTTDLVTRSGFQSWATGMTGSVETLMAYRSSAAQRLFGIASGSIYDATVQGVVGAAAMTGLSTSRWQYVNFGTIGGRFIYAVAVGTDYPILYDGTTWLRIGNGTGVTISSITFVGTLATVTTATAHGLVNGASVTVTVTGAAPAAYNVALATINVLTATTFTYTMATVPATNATTPGTFTYTPSIQGVDPRNLRNCDVINSRMWFVETNSLRAWYLPLNSIGGTAASIEFTSLAKQGGSLAGVFGWSIASTLGMQNYTVFVTTEGEVLVYQGYDPTNAATWSLASRGRIGAPVGDRFWTRIGTDVGIIGRDGVIPLTKAMQIDRSADNVAISYKIVNAIGEDIFTYRNNFGWQLQVYPIGNMLIVNVPQVPDSISIQYVMNTITNAWCRYTGLNANCFEFINDQLFFGSNDGAIYEAEVGSNDNGAPIIATAKQAFSYLGDAGSEKRFTGVRPVVTASGGAFLTFDINVDFEDKPPLSTPTLSLPGGPLMWSFPWPSPWGPVMVVNKQLQFANGIGYAAAAKVQATCKFQPISWQATTYLFEKGGPI